MRSRIPDKVTDAWVILWFPPDADRRKSCRTEEAAREWLRTNEEASSWNPILMHERVEMFIEQAIVPLSEEDLWKEEDDA